MEPGEGWSAKASSERLYSCPQLFLVSISWLPFSRQFSSATHFYCAISVLDPVSQLWTETLKQSAKINFSSCKWWVSVMRKLTNTETKTQTKALEGGSSIVAQFTKLKKSVIVSGMFRGRNQDLIQD